MLHGSPRPGVVGSELTRLLARIADTPPNDTRPVFAERLGHWLSWSDAIALSTALQAGPPPSALRTSRGAEAEAVEFQRVCSSLDASLAFGRREAGASGQGFAPYRRHCLDRQQAMQEAISALRRRLRDALVRHSQSLARLAAIDAVMEQTMAAQERSLLGLVPLRLQSHFERLQRMAGTDDRWPDAFQQDMERILRAELGHRLLPAQGLLDALVTHQKT